jgi:hypothetical protein
MRFGIGYIISFLLVGGLIITSLSLSQNPEKLLIGKWREVSWDYERKDDNRLKEIGPEVRDRVDKTLLIHNAERWEFLPDGTLFLWGKNGKLEARWRLGGRGNVLRLEHARNIVEHYNVTHLSADILILNFETNIQAKGVAKLTFGKARAG